MTAKQSKKSCIAQSVEMICSAAYKDLSVNAVKSQYRQGAHS
jgi:hypothetical protein